MPAKSKPSIEEPASSAAGKESITSIVTKGLTYNGCWDKDTFIDYNEVIYWLRQLLGFLIGIFCGVLPVTGFLGFLIFGSLNVVLPYFFYTNYSNINIDDFGPLNMLIEGFPQSFGVFLLTWIILYSAVNF
mmetsp:Transcript_8927/g.13406  ORF Transcript_8927/g.13406 Transcript_8927/m.13406 type:complete len:131 (+) Transcript_8927:67-459(+)